MNENTGAKKALSLTLLVLGVALLAAALWMDFTKTYIVLDIGFKLALRGFFLVLGALLILAGLYFYPTVMHHRSIINFLLPNAVMLYAYAWGSSVEYGFNTQKLMEQ